MSRPVVVKLGGSLLEEPGRRDAVLDRLAGLHLGGVPVVLVHGGGKALSRALSARGIASRFVAGLRVTDPETLEVAVGVLSGAVNKEIVAALLARGARACGISGCDGRSVVVRPHPPVSPGDGAPAVDLGRVGIVETCDPSLVSILAGRGYLPVVATIGTGPDGALYNVNADPLAAGLASALGAARLVFLTDVPGVLGGDGLVLPRLARAEADRLTADGTVRGGMLPKIRSSSEALLAGVGDVLIASGDSFARHGLEATEGTVLHG